MKRSNKKKGFTLVELIVVIAILAILATVSIVGYVSFIKKANRSVDEQFVTQLNTILEAEEASGHKATDIVKVQDLLKGNNVGSFEAADALNTFYWVGTENRIIIFTKDNADAATGKVTFPKDLAKKFEGTTEVSKDWNNLATGAKFVEVTGADAVAIKTALFDAIADASYNGVDVIKLPANTTVELNSADLTKLTKAQNVKIDLNGGILKSTSDTSLDIPNGKTLELSNGKYEANSIGAANKSVIAPLNSASVVLRNMTIETDGAAIFPAKTASEVIIDNCTIKAPAYCVSTNANGTASNNIKVTITNSTLEGATPVLLNVPGKLEIDNCTIKGAMQGVVVRGGTAVIKNSTITQGDGTKDNLTYFNDKNWGSGNMVNLAALTIGNKHSTSYQYPSHVELYNVKLTTINDYFPACYIIGNTGEGLGATLIYDSACTFSGLKDPTVVGGSAADYDNGVIKGNDSVTITKK